MDKKIVINMEKENFKGNVLDIGMDNYGIIYSIYKHNNQCSNVDYIDGKDKSNGIKNNFYDSCMLFLTISDIFFNYNRKSIIKKVYNYLKEDGFIYIWDINKAYGKTFFGTISVMLPNGKNKDIKLRRLNIFQDTSIKQIFKLLGEYFNIIEYKVFDEIYFIKGQKKRRNEIEETEGVISRN